MQHFGNILSTALGVLSLATLAGLGLLRGTVVNLREQLKDAREEVTAIRAGRVEDKAEIARLQSDLDAVGRLATGEAHWVALGHQLEEHHAEATTHWTRDEQVLTEIRDELRRRAR